MLQPFQSASVSSNLFIQFINIFLSEQIKPVSNIFSSNKLKLAGEQAANAVAVGLVSE
jgi:hypothetical protein